MSGTHAHKAVLAISSQVGRGSVGLRAAGFAIERLGVPVWKVPTVYLPWHPGQASRFGVPPRSAMPLTDFEASLNALSGAPFAGEAGAVLTGYFAEPGQVRAAADAIDTLRARFEGVRVVCDPVCADSHGVYVPEAVLTAISEHLLPRADWVTPNRFELALFAGAPQAEDLPGLQAMVRKLDVPCVAVTSAFGLMRGHTGVLMVQSGARAEGADTPAAPARSILFEHGLVEGAPHGTGDLLSALLTAHLVRGLAPEQALKLATASVFELVARSVKAESSELLIAAEQDSIARPMAMVTERQLARARAAG